MRVGIIGGSGMYDPQLLIDSERKKMHTPYGHPSDFVMLGDYEGVPVAIIPRHGPHHTFNPTQVNYRANIWALKELGCTHVLAPSAVGSLKEEVRPGDFVFTDQFIDRTHKRQTTFYDGSQVCHISVAEPTCATLRTLLAKEAKALKVPFHEKGTCVVIEGPRFSTKAESRMFRLWGGDIIGMTMCPEATLAREAEMCYSTIAMVTDYDVWRDAHVSLDMVLKTMKENEQKVKLLLKAVIPKIAKERACGCKSALTGALL
ncbi:S-methyl-5'-thioadenosine phosphorylase [Candidatus Woesearchaeota archaeon]|nr:S-methyl-5'-thioadenosine phosphorylase [Candidatus Woesearchaeota archaeon]